MKEKSFSWEILYFAKSGKTFALSCYPPLPESLLNRNFSCCVLRFTWTNSIQLCVQKDNLWFCWPRVKKRMRCKKKLEKEWRKSRDTQEKRRGFTKIKPSFNPTLTKFHRASRKISWICLSIFRGQQGISSFSLWRNDTHYMHVINGGVVEAKHCNLIARQELARVPERLIKMQSCTSRTSIKIHW